MPESRREFVKSAAGLGLAARAAVAGRGRYSETQAGQDRAGSDHRGPRGARASVTSATRLRRCARFGTATKSASTISTRAAAGAYGLSQKRYGMALEGTPRDKIVYGTKTRHRTYAHAELDLLQSLANLKTDYLDLYQIHNVMHLEDIDFVFGPRGSDGDDPQGEAGRQNPPCRIYGAHGPARARQDDERLRLGYDPDAAQRDRRRQSADELRAHDVAGRGRKGTGHIRDENHRHRDAAQSRNFLRCSRTSITSGRCRSQRRSWVARRPRKSMRTWPWPRPTASSARAR